jgi:hypothetical protein
MMFLSLLIWFSWKDAIIFSVVRYVETHETEAPK